MQHPTRSSLRQSLRNSTVIPLGLALTGFAGGAVVIAVAAPSAVQAQCSANPCAANPCAADKSAACGANPCAASCGANPCAAEMDASCGANPCAASCGANPCAADPCGAASAGAASGCFVPGMQEASANPCAADDHARACEANPCAASCGANPCAASCEANPCAANPCAADKGASCGANPCAASCGANPCAADPCGANPCAANPCAANPCGANPCAANPCGANPCAANPCAAAEPRTDLTEAELQTLYTCLIEKLTEAADTPESKLAQTSWLASDNRGAQDFAAWENFARVPYISFTHGERYAFNHANAIAAEEYGKFEEIDAIPAGGIIAKPTFTVSGKGEAVLETLFFMEKAPAGTMPDTNDWIYSAVMPDGSLMGRTNGRNAGNVEFCVACHQAGGAQTDDLLFLDPEYRF